MPKHNIHNFVNKLLFGRKFEKVDKTLDYSVRFLGPSHRKVFHDYLTGPLVGAVVTQNLGGIAAAVVHISLDKFCTNNKSFEKLLKNLSNRHHRNRRV